jgi:hypothetical protein
LRVDNSNPNHVYRSFWDWLTYDWHIIFVLILLIGYFYYAVTTTEV